MRPPRPRWRCSKAVASEAQVRAGVQLSDVGATYTSVEAERAFSSPGVICTKLRNRLDDTTVDTLCFLRSYYQEHSA